jgi:hypothetical protein
MSVTTESPERETERSSSAPGVPFKAFSMGIVTVRSISTGVRPDAEVSTVTCTVETSGEQQEAEEAEDGASVANGGEDQFGEHGVTGKARS